MKPLTTDDLNVIRQIVSDNWVSIGITTYGVEHTAATRDAIHRMVTGGILTQEAGAAVDLVKDAYVFGFMRRRLEQEGVKIENLTTDQFHNILNTTPMPLPQAKINAIEYAKKWGGQYVQNMADRSAAGVVRKLAEFDGDVRQMEFVGKRTAEAIKNRWSPRQLSNMLREETGNALQDWDRVAVTEIQNANENGYADELINTFGEDVLVAKLTNPDACPECKKLYTDPETGRPKIFRLAELKANGDNIGRKRSQWVATLGVIHPRCFCTLIYVPKGFGFDERNELSPLTTIKR